MEPGRIFILGVGVNPISMDGTISRIRDFIRSKKPHLVVTLGAEMVMAARRDASFKELINRASLVVPDGAGLLWASRRLGKPLVEKIAGVELVEKLCRISAAEKWRLFFLGGNPGIAEAALSSLRKKYPGSEIVGSHHGYFKDAEIIPLLKAAKPDILLAGMGSPKQELWLKEHLGSLSIPVGIGVGGSFDVLSGTLKRAPGWMIRMNLEWLFRFLQEPRRFKRILNIPAFALQVLKEGKGLR